MLKHGVIGERLKPILPMPMFQHALDNTTIYRGAPIMMLALDSTTLKHGVILQFNLPTC
jgi:hypothetical protein